MEDGKTIKRHIDHIRERMVRVDDQISIQPDSNTVQDNFQYPEFNQANQHHLLLLETMLTLLDVTLIEIDNHHSILWLMTNDSPFNVIMGLRLFTYILLHSSLE